MASKADTKTKIEGGYQAPGNAGPPSTPPKGGSGAIRPRKPKLVDITPDAEEIALGKLTSSTMSLPPPHLTLSDFELRGESLSIATLRAELAAAQERIFELERANADLHVNLFEARLRVGS